MIRPDRRHNIMKVSHPNRRLCMRLALIFSIISLISLIISCSSNDWLYTAQWQKYHISDDQIADHSIPDWKQPKYFRNATFGPWYCRNSKISTAAYFSRFPLLLILNFDGSKFFNKIFLIP